MLKVPSACNSCVASPDLKGAFNLGRMEEDGGIAIALQHLVMHAFVAIRVAALAGGCVDQNLSLGHPGCRVEKELAALQLEGAVDSVQAAQLPVDLGLGRVE